MPPTKHRKFSPYTIEVKKRVKALRIQNGHNIGEAARLLGLKPKHLESIESGRSYGCNLKPDFLAKMKIVYGCTWDCLLGEPGTTTDTLHFTPLSMASILSKAPDDHG